MAWRRMPPSSRLSGRRSISSPGTSTPLGRGPLGDVVLGVYPESICPHLSELVLGFEPYFEVEVLRADAVDFARTMRGWLVALREQQSRAAGLVGSNVVRRWL